MPTPHHCFILSHDGGGHLLADTLIQQLTPHTPFIHITHHQYPQLVGVLDWLHAIRPIAKAMLQCLRYFKLHRPKLVILVGSGWGCQLVGMVTSLMGIPSMIYIGDCHTQWVSESRMARYFRRSLKVFVTTHDEYEFVRRWGGRPCMIDHPWLNIPPTDPPLSKWEFCNRYQLSNTRPMVGVFPGSRRHELCHHLPLMCDAMADLQRQIDSLQVIISAHHPTWVEWIQTMAARSGLEATVVTDPPPTWIPHLDTSLLRLGGISLWHMRYAKPHVGIYQLSDWSYWVTRWFYRVGMRRLQVVSHPNVCLKRRVVPELIQEYANPMTIAKSLMPLLSNRKRTDSMAQELEKARITLGDGNRYNPVDEIVGFFYKQGLLFESEKEVT